MAATFCGLICSRCLPIPGPDAQPVKRLPVPLKSVSVHADVRGWSVGVTAELAYRNTLSEPIECQFVFPLSDKSAVYRLEADVAGKKLYAECRPRKEAEELYKDAVESGHTGVLLENQSGSSDVFRIMLGNLPANQEAKVTIGFVQPAERDHDGSLSFTLPTVLNPRYVPHDMLGDPEKMKEHFHFKVPYVAVSEVSYSMAFDAKISLGQNSKIAEIKATNETKDVIKVEYESGDNKTSATVRLDGKFEQDHDFGLCIVPAEPFKPMVFIEPGLKENKEGKKWLSVDIACAWFEPQAAAAGKQAGTGVEGDEFWFVIDRSGSMGGSKIEDAKTALVLFVKSLPNSCRFNIVGFGSSFSSLFPEGSVNYNDSTVEQALEYASGMTANMGGTEIFRPLEFIYSKPKPTAPGARQFIILLTDGEVGNTEQVVDLARKNAATSRVFTVGIGEGASSALVNGLARVSGGLSEFVRNAQDRLQAKVISLLKAATNPGADNISLTWEVSGGGLATKMPDKLPTAAYQGHPIMQYALVERHQGNNVDGYSRLTASSVGGAKIDHKLTFSVASSIFSDEADAMPLHRLAAKARLLELADHEGGGDVKAVKAKMAAISMATGVLCGETALVAVDGDTHQPVKDENGRPRFIDIARPTTYYPISRSFGGGGGMKMSAFSSCLCARSAPMSKGRATNGGGMMRKCAAVDEQPQMQMQMQSQSSVTSSVVAGPTRSVIITADDMEVLIRRQKLNGSWLFSNDLAKVSGSTSETLLRQQIMSTVMVAPLVSISLDESVVATLIGLALLRRKFAHRRDEWELIEQKALNFLLTAGKIDSARIDELVSAIGDALAI